MGRSKTRKLKKTKPTAPQKRIRWHWKTWLVYVPLTILAFGMVFGATLIHVLHHPDFLHVMVFCSFVVMAIYLFYYSWKTQ